LQNRTLPIGAASHAARRKRGAPVRKRTRRSRDVILNRIVQAAAVEFKRCGYAGTTTAAIARKAQVTEAQLFRYFESKSYLFRETIFKPLDQHFLKFVNKHMPNFNEAASVREMTRRYTLELQRFIGEHAEVLKSVVVAQRHDPATLQGAAEIDSLRAYFDRCASITSERIKVRPRIDPRLTVRVSFVAVLGCVLFKDWIFPSRLANEQEITAAIGDFVMGGVAASSSKG
jgi:AcrR family transcriptional regulator